VSLCVSVCAKECESNLLDLDWRKAATPLDGGETRYCGCVVCDEFLEKLCEVKHGRSFVRRGGRGGRGRGRRGRGRRRAGDPLLSFRDF
jgi:DNA topoisomerase III